MHYPRGELPVWSHHFLSLPKEVWTSSAIALSLSLISITHDRTLSLSPSFKISIVPVYSYHTNPQGENPVESWEFLSISK